MSDSSTVIEAFWQAYLLTLPQRERRQRYFEAVSWGNSPELEDRIASLIAEGIKTTTSSLLWSQQVYQWPVEQPGDKSIVLDSKKSPVCFIETVRVETRPFNEVDADFVYRYGEGDRTMHFWNHNMWVYYQQECTALGREAASEMPMICQEFKVIYTA
jgi:uncharacterized protein YhfF